ncbi:glutamate receptor U1 isoform X2 [Ooceraea biroi]|nr:glutamate receptor U1 isoform X2 [Ooceraea biroi]
MLPTVSMTLHQSIVNTRADRMLLAILCILALLLSDNTIVCSHRIDDIILKFIVNATPVLFPPSRISVHLCIDYEDTIRLSKQMSNHHLTHGINNFIKDFDGRIYNNLEHQNLYMLDLNCDYAIEVLRQAHSKRMFVAPTKWLLVQDRRMIIDNTNVTSTYNDSILEVFEDIAVYPDSDVILARRYDNDFLELISIYRPSPQKGVIWEERGNWTIQSGLRMRTFDVASARRRNLQQTALKSCIVVTDPDTVNHLTDFEKITIDTITKVSYPWILHLANRMNATISFQVSNTWGYTPNNGSWSGMTGMLHRREIDIGGTTMLITADRMSVVKFIQLYTHTSACFIFRRPLVSNVKNIFTLPFKRNVWIAIAVFLALVLCLLYISMKWEYHTVKKSATYRNQLNTGEHAIGENLLVLLGAFTQQGYSYEPYIISTRIITFMLLIASLSLYTSYTANIVALLQSTTDSIKTLSDLLHSSLTLGVLDIVYFRYYFTSFEDPIRKAITEQKIEPKGRKSGWMSLEEGVNRIRNEPFALHGGRGQIYYVMQRTYQEEEKCGLSEIDYLGMTYPLLAIQKQSPYSEIIKNGALKLREYGLKYREEYRLYPRKPVCSNQAGYIKIGFTECYFAMVIMGYGMLLSVILLILEFLWYKRQNKDVMEKTASAMTDKVDPGTIKYIG